MPTTDRSSAGTSTFRRRWPSRGFGFDTTDWQLDLWIEPAGDIHWKDEDDLERAVELEILTSIEAEQAREEAHRVLEEWPFPDRLGRLAAGSRPGRHPRFRAAGMWSEGDVICVRQTWLGRVWQAHAWYVVADGDDELVLFAPIGAEAWFSGIPIPCDEWTLKRSSFKVHLLLFARPGEGYSTSLIWDASWTLREWYVNFERPLRPRSPIGFDYVDLALDLVGYPDGTGGSCSTRTSWRRDWRAAY